jgi:cellulose biosynthesis protein BcsQ
MPVIDMPDVPQWLEPVKLTPGLAVVGEDAELPLQFGFELPAKLRIATAPLQMHSRVILRFPLGEPEFHPQGLRLKVAAVNGILPFRIRTHQEIAIFSLVGGTGRTSIAANLARVLAGSGLRVLLADTCAHSLLPRLFGAGDTQQGVMRSFSPIGLAGEDETHRKISMVSLDVDAFAGDDVEQFRVMEEFSRDSARMDRVIWDLSGASLDWSAKVLPVSPQILIPVLPTANSLVQLRATERFLNCCHDEDPAAHIRYVLNDFDELDPLHVEMRNCFRQRLGSRMLQVALRRSPLVDESLSLGRTVVDHAPQSLLADDLFCMAEQLGQLAVGAEVREEVPLQWREQ